MLIKELSFITLLYKLIKTNTLQSECHVVCSGTSEKLSSHHMNGFVWTASTYVQYTAYYSVLSQKISYSFCHENLKYPFKR